MLGAVVNAEWIGNADAGTAPVHDVAVVPLVDGFETGTTFRGAVCSGCESFFHPVTSDAHTGSQSFFAPDSAMAGFVIVNSSSVIIPQNASAADLTFWQRFEFEHNVPFNYDGGVLELDDRHLNLPGRRRPTHHGRRLHRYHRTAWRCKPARGSRGLGG